MAKRKPVKKILKLTAYQVMKLSDENLKKYVSTMNAAANKRIKRAKSQGYTSGVIERITERPEGKFSIKGKDSRAKLEAAFMDVKQFLESKTSTVRGIKASQDKMFKELAKKVNPDLPADQQINPEDWYKDKTDTEIKDITDLVWTQVDKIAENKQFGITKKERYALAAHAFEVVTRTNRPVTDKKSLYQNLKKFYQEGYIKSVESEDDEIELTEEEQKIAAMYKDFT